MTTADSQLAAARGALRVARSVSDEHQAMMALYHGVYACGYAGRGSLEPFYIMGSGFSDASFVAGVVAQASLRPKTSEWRVLGVSARELVLEGSGIRASWSQHPPDSVTVAVGSMVAVPLPSIVAGASPGFLWTCGNSRPSLAELSRLYLNITPRHAAWVLGELAKRLDEAGIPFDAKVLAHPQGYRRRDACVIYVPSSRIEATLDVIARELCRAGRSLRAPIPLFTKRLMDGVGFADEPSDISPTGMSHGLWVSGLYLEATTKVEAMKTRLTAATVASRVRELVEATGRDPDHPYLRPRAS